MMDATTLKWIISQGIGAVLAFAMFIYHSKVAQSWAERAEKDAEGYMKFGEKYAESLTKITDILSQQQALLDAISSNMTHTSYCPVSQLSNEVIKDLRGYGRDVPRSKIEAAVVKAIRETLKVNTNED